MHTDTQGSVDVQMILTKMKYDLQDKDGWYVSKSCIWYRSFQIGKSKYILYILVSEGVKSQTPESRNLPPPPAHYLPKVWIVVIVIHLLGWMWHSSKVY